MTNLCSPLELLPAAEAVQHFEVSIMNHPRASRACRIHARDHRMFQARIRSCVIKTWRGAASLALIRHRGCDECFEILPKKKFGPEFFAPHITISAVDHISQ